MGGIISCECPGCNEQFEPEEVCAICLGTGEESVKEKVYPGEPHEAWTTVPCRACKKVKNDEHES